MSGLISGCEAVSSTSPKGSGSTSSPAALTKSESHKLKTKFNHLLKDWQALKPDADESEAATIATELSAILNKLGEYTEENVSNGFWK